MAIIGGEETATETVDMVHVEKVKPSKFGEFCRRNGINPNLIMLKITLFVMYGGEYYYYVFCCLGILHIYIRVCSQ